MVGGRIGAGIRARPAATADLFGTVGEVHRAVRLAAAADPPDALGHTVTAHALEVAQPVAEAPQALAAGGVPVVAGIVLAAAVVGDTVNIIGIMPDEVP